MYSLFFQVASQLELSERQVKTWFQNRRTKYRRQKTSTSPHLTSPSSSSSSMKCSHHMDVVDSLKTSQFFDRDLMSALHNKPNPLSISHSPAFHKEQFNNTINNRNNSNNNCNNNNKTSSNDNNINSINNHKNNNSIQNSTRSPSEHVSPKSLSQFPFFPHFSTYGKNTANQYPSPTTTTCSTNFFRTLREGGYNSYNSYNRYSTTHSYRYPNQQHSLSNWPPNSSLDGTLLGFARCLKFHNLGMNFPLYRGNLTQNSLFSKSGCTIRSVDSRSSDFVSRCWTYSTNMSWKVAEFRYQMQLEGSHHIIWWNQNNDIGHWCCLVLRNLFGFLRGILAWYPKRTRSHIKIEI